MLFRSLPICSLPRGQNETRLLRCFCGVVLNCQSYSLSCRSMYPPGTFTCYTRPDPDARTAGCQPPARPTRPRLAGAYDDVVLRASLQEQHRHIGIFGQAAGDDRPGGPAAHDNV